MPSTCSRQAAQREQAARCVRPQRVCGRSAGAGTPRRAPAARWLEPPGPLPCTPAAPAACACPTRRSRLPPLPPAPPCGNRQAAPAARLRWPPLACARMARICTVSSSVYGWVRMITRRSSRSIGTPCGDSMSVPRTCRGGGVCVLNGRLCSVVFVCLCARVRPKRNVPSPAQPSPVQPSPVQPSPAHPPRTAPGWLPAPRWAPGSTPAPDSGR